MKATAKVSSKSQITIPAWVRERLGILPGSRLALRVEGERLILERLDAGIAGLEGALKGMYGDARRYVRGLRDEWKRLPG
ncbi:MAG: AbrB/MazE/SpoVT family DNA-binding domain-containing protein [Actinomycetota bacterium]